MSKTKVVIAGGTGFVGRHLVEELANAGYDCVVLSRDGKAPAGAQAVTWNSDAGAMGKRTRRSMCSGESDRRTD